MTAVQIVCIIGAMLMCFVIGRATKRFKIPIMGIFTLEGDDEQPKMMFKCNSFKDLKKYNYIAIKIESRQNQSL